MSPRPPGMLSQAENPDVLLMIGTAGHVDHGKTRLVRFLTGCETDRLKEEQERGLSIELGFAPCSLGPGIACGIVDVPGHEQFIRNMVAGAAGMDLCILVVAADDGVMPQTVEHLQIMQFLGVQAGLVAITKIDLVEPERIEEVRREIEALVSGTFLEGAAVCPVSSETFAGFERFYTTLVDVALHAKVRRQRGVFRMPVERVFISPGHGTVVTGIPLAGRVREGEEVEIQPGGARARVRGIQRFLRAAAEGGAGQCLALNLAGLSREAVERGAVVAAPGYVGPVSILLARLSTCDNLSPPLRSGEEVRVHTGTVEVQARLSLYDVAALPRGAEGFASLHLAHPVAASPTDRLVVRRNSPSRTVAGGVIVRALAEKPRASRGDRGGLAARWQAFATPRGALPPSLHRRRDGRKYGGPGGDRDTSVELRYAGNRQPPAFPRRVDGRFGRESSLYFHGGGSLAGSHPGPPGNASGEKPERVRSDAGRGRGRFTPVRGRAPLRRGLAGK
ncbi:selenocysteine-specific translation elongation factor [bacterium]|nr:selenocysteine-specific translation elongation factor [bacterium]